jgi:D-xylulose kinase
MGPMTTFLGLDLGTQGLKAVLLDPERGLVATAGRPLATIQGLPSGHSEQQPADWIEAARGACADLRRSAAGALAAVAAVGVSGQQHGLVALDAADRVLRPALLWNDVRAARESAEILAAVGGSEAACAHFGLAALPPGFTAGKLRWLWRHAPQQFAAIRRVLLPHDFLNLWLTGRPTSEAGDASGTGWFDVRRRRFAAELCAATAPGTAALLPEVLEAGAAVGTVRPAVAAELGIPAAALVATGAGDNMAAAIGAGAVRPGIAVLSLGTSGTVFAHSAEPVCDPAGEIAPFCDSTGAHLPLGCTMNATVATELARRLGGYDLPAFERAVAAIPAGAEGLLCLPFFTGERSPDLPTATGAFVGIDPRNATTAHLARAAMEGATFALARLLDRLRGLGLRIDELRLTGGGSRSPTWARIVAAVAGAPVRIGVDADAAALGAAIQALWTWRRAGGETALGIAACRDALGLDDDLETLDCVPKDRERYAERRPAWQRLVDAMIPTYPKAADEDRPEDEPA